MKIYNSFPPNFNCWQAEFIVRKEINYYNKKELGYLAHCCDCYRYSSRITPHLLCCIWESLQGDWKQILTWINDFLYFRIAIGCYFKTLGYFLYGTFIKCPRESTVHSCNSLLNVPAVYSRSWILDLTKSAVTKNKKQPPA